MRKIIMLALLCLSLNSCSRPYGEIIAEIENSKIMFHIRYPGLFLDKVFGWDDENHQIETLFVFSDNKIIWSFTMSNGLFAPYPVTYGQEVISSTVTVAPQKLQRNKDYKILVIERPRQKLVNDDIDIDSIDYDAIGSFRLNLDGSIANLKSY